jgi:hypothetical protein
MSLRILLSLLIFAGLTNLVNGQGFNNPSFETPVLSGPTLVQEVTPSSVFAGFNTPTTWNVVSGAIDIVKVGSPGGYWNDNAVDGSQIIDLSGSTGTRGTIRQTINTGSLTSINFAFNYSRNVDFIPNLTPGVDNNFSASVRIFAGSTNFLNTSVSINAAGLLGLGDGRGTNNFAWQTFSQSVTVPAGTNITLEFVDTTTAANSTNQGLLIDNVRPVPEPISAFAILAGVGVLGRLANRRRA